MAGCFFSSVILPPLGEMTWHQRQEVLEFARRRARDFADGDGAHIEALVDCLTQVSLQPGLIWFGLAERYVAHLDRIVVGLHHLHLLERDEVAEAADRHVRINDAAVLEGKRIAVTA